MDPPRIVSPIWSSCHFLDTYNMVKVNYNLNLNIFSGSLDSKYILKITDKKTNKIFGVFLIERFKFNE